ncbi:MULTISPECIES: CCA tRNA nucleotidyltransferase [Prochlorococcus]|uniref:CCA tRNA nucleotidyltransferase n=1 Tax=Prochlorococcus TaxID=1218 RepID=UPI001F4CBBF9|nr:MULTISPECIES: CCA tRNA nucleotidyltransferase [Prochlorococcus]
MEFRKDHSLLAQSLSERLDFSRWPVSLKDLPIGSALVGGSIRDALLNRLQDKPDLDLVVPSDAIKLAKQFAEGIGGTCVVLDETRDIARWVIKEWTVDFASQIGTCLKEDLLRRDYTINAIALVLLPEPQILDPTGGLIDLTKKQLIAVSEQNLIDDPLRLLRGFRFLAELNFFFDNQTKFFLESNAHLLRRVARERIKGELEKLIQGIWADQVIPSLNKSRLLEPWQVLDQPQNELIELSPNFSAFNSTELEIGLPLIRLTKLLSDQGLKELSFSRKKLQNCHLLRYWQLKNDGFAFENLSENDRFRLHKDLENILPALILGLSFRDQKLWLKRWRDNDDPLFHPSCPLDGGALQKIISASEGPWIGELINLISQEKAFGRLKTEEEVFQFARYWWAHNKPFCD